MIVISNMRYDYEDIERMKLAGIEYYYADNGGADPHAVTSRVYNVGVENLPSQIRENAVAMITPAYHVTDELLELCPCLQWIHHLLSKNMIRFYENKRDHIYYSAFSSYPAPLLRDKTVLIMGTGNTGTEIARILKISL